MPNDMRFLQAVQDAPIIAAVKNDEGLEKALKSDCTVIFFLYGSICTISSLVQRAKDTNKLVFVHLDLIEGLSNRDVSVNFIKSTTLADGIISTRPNLIRRGKECGLFAIQRFFLLDSLAFANIKQKPCEADAIDILPGTQPKIISRLCAGTSIPIIASGLISDKEDIVAALGAGAVAVSATSAPLWFL